MSELDRLSVVGSAQDVDYIRRVSFRCFSDVFARPSQTSQIIALEDNRNNNDSNNSNNNDSTSSNNNDSLKSI